MRYRKLRIAWSVGWAIVAVLLCVLWVRSYWWWDWYNSRTVARQNVTIGSTQGWLGIVIRMGTIPDVPPRQNSLSSVPVDELPAADGQWELHASQYPWGVDYSITIPHWFLAFSAAILASAPWLASKRFSLRTMLIATTLVALVLGLIVWAVK